MRSNAFLRDVLRLTDSVAMSVVCDQLWRDRRIYDSIAVTDGFLESGDNLGVIEGTQAAGSPSIPKPVSFCDRFRKGLWGAANADRCKRTY
jgi:hypothetical protein